MSLYLVLQSFFHLFLNPAMVPDENSMEDPLCNSSFGSMVSLDYVTPDTVAGPVPGKPVHETSVIQTRSSEDRKDFNVEQSPERTGRPVNTHDVISVPDSSQTRSVHESETFNVGDETFRERMERPVKDHDDFSCENIMVNEADMDDRIRGLPHSVVKHAAFEN